MAIRSEKVLTNINRQLSSSECASVFAILLLVMIAAIFSYGNFLKLSIAGGGDCSFYDFQLRYNEVQCLLSGVDPFDVWSGVVSFPPYSAFYWGCPFFGWHHYVHAYPPWSYFMILPFAVLPKPMAAVCWSLLERLCIAYLYGFAFWCSRKTAKPIWIRVVPVIVALPVLPSVYECLVVSNFGLLIAVSVLLMAVCLNHDRQFFAGIFLSLAMIKPQIGLLFVVPLLVGGKFKTVAYGGIICVLASIPPALMCGKSPIDMILSIKEYSSAYSIGNLPVGAFVPARLPFLQGQMSMVCNMIANALVGVVVCAVLSCLFRNERNWLARIIPASVLCVMWTVSRPSDACVLIIPFIAVGKVVIDDCRGLDTTCACILPYVYFIMVQGLGLPFAFPVAVVVCIGIAVACLAFYVVRRRYFPRNILLVAMPIAILCSSVESLDMIIWPLVYLISIVYAIKEGWIKALLNLLPLLALLFFSGRILPSQTAGWALVVLLCLMGKAWHRIANQSYIQEEQCICKEKRC